MVEIYVDPNDFNTQFRTAEEAAEYFSETEGMDEFEVVKITVGFRMGFKIVDGKPQMNTITELLLKD